MDRIVTRVGLGLVLTAVAFAAAVEIPKITSIWDLVHLVVTPQCVDTFLGGDLLNAACLKTSISKALGYAIILGACVVKVPQIIAIVRNGSTEGISANATYLDLLGYLLQSAYHLILGSPFSAYGETLIITVQSIGIVLLMWGYRFPGVTHASIVSSLLAVATAVPFNIGVDKLAYLQLVSSIIFSASRLIQITKNYSESSTGQLAFLTLFMNFGGSAARVFTSSVEIKQVEVFYSFVVSTVLNGLLVAQYVYYNWIAGKKAGAKAQKESGASKKDDDAPRAADVKAAEPVAAVQPEAAAPPSSGSGRASRRKSAGKGQ